MEQNEVKWEWLYVRDCKSLEDLYKVADWWLDNGYRVFIQGYSAMDIKEYKR